MKNVTVLKQKPSPWPVVFAYAVVVGRERGGYQVMTDDGQALIAQKAAGCLLLPEKEDRVLLACGEGGESFVMEVLVKANGQGEVVVPKDTTIRSEDGKLRMHSQTIVLTATEKATVEAPAVSLSGVAGEVRFLSFSLLAKTMGVRLQKASLLVDVLDTVCGRLSERITNSFRHIENLEETKAGRLRTIVRERFALRAKQTSILSEEDVTIDGKKIHLG